MVNHSIFKSLLFLTSGALEYSLGTRDLKIMSKNTKSVSEQMPMTTFSAFIGSLSISGVPPFNGFWSKLIIIIACVESKNLFAGFVAIGISLLTTAIFLKVLKYGFYSGGANNEIDNQQPESGIEKQKEAKEVPFWMKFAMIGLVILCFSMGILIYPGIKNLLLSPVSEILTKGYKYSSIIMMNK